MIIQSVCLPKRQLTTITENETLEKALELLEDSGYRCIPVLDESQKYFKGNIYKMHIYRHLANQGDMSLPVTHLIKNTQKYIYLDSSFFEVFFTIKELPYIAVLNEKQEFYGILTHSKLLNILSQSWDVKEGRYVITVASTGKQGDLAAMAKIIAKYSSIASCITLDVEKDKLIRRTLFTLPANTSKTTLKQIIDHLEKKDFNVVEIEELQKERAKDPIN